MGQISAQFNAQNNAIRAISWNGDSTKFAVARGNLLEIFDAATREVLLTLESDSYNINGLAWNPRRNMLASAHVNGVVRLWDTDTGAILAEYEYAPPPQTVFSSDVGRNLTITRTADCVAWNP